MPRTPKPNAYRACWKSRARETNQVPERSGGTDWLPYSAIDRLFALCEANLARTKPSPSASAVSSSASEAKERKVERREVLAEAFETAQERLVGYFKVSSKGGGGGVGSEAEKKINGGPRDVFVMCDTAMQYSTNTSPAVRN